MLIADSNSRSSFSLSLSLSHTYTRARAVLTLWRRRFKWPVNPVVQTSVLEYLNFAQTLLTVSSYSFALWEIKGWRVFWKCSYSCIFWNFQIPYNYEKFVFRLYEILQPFKLRRSFRFVSLSTVFKIIKSQLQRILCSFRIANALKLDTWLYNVHYSRTFQFISDHHSWAKWKINNIFGILYSEYLYNIWGYLAFVVWEMFKILTTCSCQFR
jgi:hypothetical protein